MIFRVDFVLLEFNCSSLYQLFPNCEYFYWLAPLGIWKIILEFLHVKVWETLLQSRVVSVRTVPTGVTLNTLHFVRALCLCAPCRSSNTQPLFSIHEQLIGLCNGNEYCFLWMVIFVGFSVAPPTPSLRQMSEYYCKRSSFIRLFVLR